MKRRKGKGRERIRLTTAQCRKPRRSIFAVPLSFSAGGGNNGEQGEKNAEKDRGAAEDRDDGHHGGGQSDKRGIVGFFLHGVFLSSFLFYL